MPRLSRGRTWSRRRSMRSSLFLRLAIGITLVVAMAILSAMLDRPRHLRLQPLLFLVALVATLFAVYDPRDPAKAFFSPSALMALYVSAFFAVGSWAFSRGLVLTELAGYSVYYGLARTPKIAAYFLAAVAATLCARPFSHVVRGSPGDVGVVEPAQFQRRRPLSFVLALAVAAFAASVELPLPGGEGSYSSIYFMFATIYAAYYLRRLGSPFRFPLYAVTGVVLAAVFYTDRRLVVFYGFIVAFLELLYKQNLKIRLRHILSVAVVAIAMATAIVAMSIRRGVGAFDTVSVGDAVGHVDDYVRADWALTMLLHNFEAPPTFFHSYHAVDYMMQTRDYQFGSTILKVFFIPVSRELFPAKPRSMVDDYTSKLYPSYRASGGSWVPNLYAEAFWNFGFLGSLVWLVLLFRSLDWGYSICVDRLRRSPDIHLFDVAFLAALSFLPFYLRGSGLDLYTVYVLLFAAMALVGTAVDPRRWVHPTSRDRSAPLAEGPVRRA